MTRSEAFAILRLSEDADESLVKEAYRRSSLEKHPDKVGGDNEEQARINEAYRVALSAITSTALDLQTRLSLERVESALLVERSARKAQTEARAIKRRRRRRLDKLRNLSLVAGISSGALLLFYDKIFDPLIASGNISQGFKLPLGLLTATFCAGALWINNRVQQLEFAIEACIEELSDRKFCATELARLLTFQDVTVVPENELFYGPREENSLDTLGFFSFSADITRREFRRLLIPKAVEHRLLEPVETKQFARQTVIQYRVLFRPSLFKPEPEASPVPPKPMSKQEARSMTLGGAMSSAILVGLTAYLAVILKTNWAWLPGFLSLGPVLVLVSGAVEWYGARKREG
jgi:hypothetical protein